MSVGDRFQYAWCNFCGCYFPPGQAHACTGGMRGTFQPYPPGERVGAQVVPVLTEADVRRIVREELARATGAAS